MGPTPEEIQQAKDRLGRREYLYKCDVCDFERVIVVKDSKGSKKAIWNELVKHEDIDGHHLTHTGRLSAN